MTSFLCVTQIGLEPVPQPQSAQRRYGRLCLFRLRKASMKFPLTRSIIGSKHANTYENRPAWGLFSYVAQIGLEPMTLRV